MSITTIETKIKTTVTNLLGGAKADIGKVEAIAAEIVADVRKTVTRAVLIAFGVGLVLGAVIKACV